MIRGVSLCKKVGTEWLSSCLGSLHNQIAKAEPKMLTHCTSICSNIDSIIHGLETREITEIYPRFDFRKLFDLQVSCRCLQVSF